jgi:co-chaperonin GroES (HSP10)
MEVIPHNKRLLVEVQKEEVEQSLFVIPDEARQKSEWTTGKVVLASDRDNAFFAGRNVIFLTHMLETISIHGKEYHFIESNHVVASHD